MEEETTLLKVVYRAENMRVVEKQGNENKEVNIGVVALGYGIGKAASNFRQGRNILTGKEGMSAGARHRQATYMMKNATSDIIGLRDGKRVLTQHNDWDYDLYYSVDAGGRVGNYLGMVEHGNMGVVGKAFSAAFAGSFASSGGVVIYGNGMRTNLISGDKSSGGNRSVYDMSDWSAGGDKNDFLEWLWNKDASSGPQYDTIDQGSYKVIYKNSRLHKKIYE